MRTESTAEQSMLFGSCGLSANQQRDGHYMIHMTETFRRAPEEIKPTLQGVFGGMPIVSVNFIRCTCRPGVWPCMCEGPKRSAVQAERKEADNG